MKNEEILAHHGILGQKWGIRRFQNPDGSLTPAGRKRAKKLKNEYRLLTGKKLKGKIPKEDPKKKSIKELNDNELSDRLKRLRNEKEARNLEKDLSSNGKKFVRTIGSAVIAPAAIEAGKNVLTKMFTKMANDALGVDTKGTDSVVKELKKATEIAELKNRKDKAERELNQRSTKDKINRLEEELRILEHKKSERIKYIKKGKNLYPDLDG